MTEFDPAPTHRNFYGRRHGKTLRQSQKGYLSEDLGDLPDVVLHLASSLKAPRRRR